AAAMLQHLGDLVLGAEKGAGQVDRDGVVPARLRDAGRWTGLADRASVVEGDVEPAEALARERHERLGVVLRAYVAGERRGRSTRGFDLGDKLRELALAPGADDDLCAFGGEELRRGAADARRGTGHERNLVLQTQHVRSLELMSGRSRRRSRTDQRSGAAGGRRFLSMTARKRAASAMKRS